MKKKIYKNKENNKILIKIIDKIKIKILKILIAIVYI